MSGARLVETELVKKVGTETGAADLATDLTETRDRRRERDVDGRHRSDRRERGESRHSHRDREDRERRRKRDELDDLADGLDKSRRKELNQTTTWMTRLLHLHLHLHLKGPSTTSKRQSRQ